jgi:uncharacterized protein YbaR (Trm112 family)
MIPRDLLAILCCPETHQRLEPADTAIIEKLNQQIAAGRLRNRGGQVVQEQIAAGLVREDRKWLYPVRNEIPIMLIDEALPLT